MVKFNFIQPKLVRRKILLYFSIGLSVFEHLPENAITQKIGQTNKSEIFPLYTSYVSTKNPPVIFKCKTLEFHIHVAEWYVIDSLISSHKCEFKSARIRIGFLVRSLV